MYHTFLLLVAAAILHHDVVAVATCDTDPCLNNGFCVDWLGAGYCFCPPNYAGEDCSQFAPGYNATCDCLWPTGVSANACDSDPCLNYGTCVEALGGYQCICMPGAVGPQCNRASKPVSCDSRKYARKTCNFPQDNTVIIELVVQNQISKTLCVENVTYGLILPGTIWVEAGCRAIFFITCDVDACWNVTCAAGEVCINQMISYQCVPNPDPCLPVNPCQNSGVCNNLGDGTYNCTCVSSFLPPNCAVFDFCGQGLCGVHTVNCTNLPGNFFCFCEEFFSGPTCTTEATNGCQSDPCQNNATCVRDTAPNYTCQCPLFYSGTNCETENGMQLIFIGFDTVGNTSISIFHKQSGWSLAASFVLGTTTTRPFPIPTTGDYFVYAYNEGTDGLVIERVVTQPENFNNFVIIGGSGLAPLYTCGVTIPTLTMCSAGAGATTGDAALCYFFPPINAPVCYQDILGGVTGSVACSGGVCSGAIATPIPGYPGVLPSQDYSVICEIRVTADATYTGEFSSDSCYAVQPRVNTGALGGDCPVLNRNGLEALTFNLVEIAPGFKLQQPGNCVY